MTAVSPNSNPDLSHLQQGGGGAAKGSLKMSPERAMSVTTAAVTNPVKIGVEETLSLTSLKFPGAQNAANSAANAVAVVAKNVLPPVPKPKLLSGLGKALSKLVGA